MKRYQVREISGHDARKGALLAEYKTVTAAKRFADRNANDYYYGVVVVDSLRDKADWGDGWESCTPYGPYTGSAI